MADLSDDGGAKSGRVRKKSAKVLEMEEFEEAEKKQFSKKTEAPKCSKTPPSPAPIGQPPAKKQKIKVEKVEVSPVSKPAQAAVVTPPQTKVSPQSAKAGQTPSSVIKFLLSSPAIPTTPSVSTKAVTKTSPELSPQQVSPVLKKSLKTKVKLEPGFAAMETEEGEPVAMEIPPAPVKQEVEVKPKVSVVPAQQLPVPTPIFSPPTASSKPIDAAGSKDSLKMKLILSPKEKKPKASFEQMLESGNEAALALAKSVKKKKKKPVVDPNSGSKDAITPKAAPPPEPATASQAMPNLAALVTSGKKKSSTKKKIKVPSGDVTPQRPDSVAAALSANKLGESPIDMEYKYEPNLVIAEDADKVKAKKKLSSSGSKTKKKLSSSSGPAPPEGDIAALAAKVKVGDKKGGKKKEKEDADLLSKKRKRPPTAYTLYCNAHRAKLVTENPGIDFAQISRRLGEMWQTLTKKEKWCWRRKAKKLAGKGSTLISTGKGNKSKSHSASASVAAAAAAASATPSASTTTSAGVDTPAAPSLPVAKPMVAHQGARIAKAVVEESALSPIKGFGTEAVDVAAHLKLLGESLSIIGMRLQEHKGLIAVQGSMSVLLDSLLCSFGPLMCLTQQVPELNGCSRQTHAKTLDHIAYVMPGL